MVRRFAVCRVVCGPCTVLLVTVCVVREQGPTNTWVVPAREDVVRLGIRAYFGMHAQFQTAEAAQEQAALDQYRQEQLLRNEEDTAR